MLIPSTATIPSPSSSSQESRVWVLQDAIDSFNKPIKTPLKDKTTPVKSLNRGDLKQFAPKKLTTPTQSFGTQGTEDNSSCGSNHSMGRSLIWNWKEGYLQEHSDVLKIKVDDTLIVLPVSALEDKQVVLANDQTAEDLIKLTHLHEPAVVEAMQIRYSQDLIYTYTGPVLLALNPFGTIQGLYGESVQRKYAEAAENHTVVSPHVYAVADQAFRSMMRSLEDEQPNPNQSILVSGESGSGKTVTTKFVMKYLASLSQRQQHETIRAYKLAQEPTKWNQRKDEVDMTGNSIEAQVLQSNPILESFGNARTVRNDNSSRFGKFIEIQFENGKLVGAQMETYLLEKVRLNRQSAGERNYHIFYELLSKSMNARELSQFYLALSAGPEDFRITAQSGCFTRRDGVTDRETFGNLKTALTTMKFTDVDIRNVLSVTAAILHASNLTFVEESNESCRIDDNNVHIPAVCNLLGLSKPDLDQALNTCTITAGDSTVQKKLSVVQAISGLEALLKETYGALFCYLVQRINHQMSGPGGQASIGVLDIFGFESFTVNSFEQLCINYCNEALQQQFNAFVLKNEQAEYEREGISWDFIEFPENQDVLDLIEKRGSSILSILDDQCRAPGPSDKAFSLAVYSQCKHLPRFAVSRKQEALLQFSVHHYAGPVEYTVTGFTNKNKDELPKETVVLLSKSELPLVRELAGLMESAHEVLEMETPRKLHRADSSVGRPTVAGQFRRQLKRLRQKIDQTAPHYIRCLKPNDLLVPDYFDTAIVAEQLRCGGILEAVRVARAGFTQHYPHEDFLRRYRALAWRELAPLNSSTSDSGRSPSWKPPVRTSPVRSTYRNSYPLPFVPKSATTTPTKNTREKQKTELSASEAKAQCKDLLKILYRKIKGVVAESPVKGATANPSPVAKAKTYTFNTPTTAPSWSKNGLNKSASKSENTTKSPSPTWTRSPAMTDFAKVGIQVGKTKIFLRHKAFEALEKIRSTEQTKAATKLNSIFRRYLARIAYLPYRNCFRNNIRMYEENAEFKESKEAEVFEGRNFDSLRSSFHKSSYASGSLVDVWTGVQLIREAIHNPVPRHEWGRQAVDSAKFKWVLRDGLWLRNYEN